MIKVLLADKLSPWAVELLKEIPEFDTFENVGLPADLLKQKIQEYGAVIVRNATQLTRRVLAGAKKLKIIVRAGIDLDYIDLENVYPAPHLGASTVEGQERAGVDAVLILKEFLNV